MYIVLAHVLDYFSTCAHTISSRVPNFSPFAPTNEGGGAEEETDHHDNETSSSGGIKGQMNVLDQVLHADCKPVLEFTIVCVYYISWHVCVHSLFLCVLQKPGTELRFRGAIILEG